MSMFKCDCEVNESGVFECDCDGPEAPKKKFRARFHARPLGSIGKRIKVDEFVEAWDSEHANRLLYEKWDHITGLELILGDKRVVSWPDMTLKPLPPPDKSKLWINDEIHRYHTVRDQEQYLRIVGWLMRLGFKKNGSMAHDSGGWTRYENTRQADEIMDYEHKMEPRSYARGAVGAQLTWHWYGEEWKCRLKIWRNLQNPDRAHAIRERNRPDESRICAS